MRLKSILYSSILLLLFQLTLYAQSSSAGLEPYKNSSLSPRDRAMDLLKRMNLKEKIGQLVGLREAEPEDTGLSRLPAGAISAVFFREEPKIAAEKYNEMQKRFINSSRLGIPMLMHGEGILGIQSKKTTAFPQPLGQAATWNPQLMEEMMRVIVTEAKSLGFRQFLSPNINLVRDPRWGRTHETYGEDPLLIKTFGKTFVKYSESNGIITTPKHFPANYGDNGLNSGSVDYSESMLREVFFPAFKACIQEAGATSIMPAYNSVNGTAVSVNRWLMDDILRKEWGFKGFVVSDYASIRIAWERLFQAPNEIETAKQALEAGINVELPTDQIYRYLPDAIEKGIVSEALINERVLPVLEAKFKIGLFDSPYIKDPQAAESICGQASHREVALKMARESIVLLRNKDKTLPLRDKTRSIALLGPLADQIILGGYAPSGMETVSLYQGLKKELPASVQVKMERGVNIEGIDPIRSSFLSIEDKGTIVEGLRGEYFQNQDLSGTPVLTRVDKQVDFRWDEKNLPSSSLKLNPLSVRWTGKLKSPATGRFRIGAVADDGVRIYINGDLVVNKWRKVPNYHDPYTHSFSYEFQKGKIYDIRVEYYNESPRSQIRLGWDVEDQGIEKAVQLAKGSDYAIIVAGVLDGENRDRATLDLPEPQVRLIKQVAQTGVPTIVVLQTANVITMQDWIYYVDAVIEAWSPGQEGGTAIAELLLGRYSPSGRLPITFPKKTEQVPIYYNVRPGANVNLNYADIDSKPLFPFGYGLSYTTFEYSNLQLSKTKIQSGESLEISMEVSNTGKMEGAEVVQLYLRDQVASTARPVKDLKGFQKVYLKPGQKEKITFAITPADLEMLDRNMKWVIEPGKFDVMVGSSSEDIRLSSVFEVL
jgi:beta-glucosidase